eukprot:Phypoly_transcript_00640.p1 GENE.Phypoly_transcript_00640~~Phypoly_transcript_00640.p1  ORF type:complete len:1212 (+),score=296.22 Phypoly_transcript_00640:141-3776(+)
MSNLVDIPASQRLYYDQLFKIADADGDGVIGLNDSAFFKKSGLPNAVLGEVWQLSDYRKVGNLDREGFFVALSLISLAQQGKRLGLDVVREKVPPPKLVDVPPMQQDVPPHMPIKQDPDWIVSPQERKLYLDIFRQNDDDGDGFITGGQARNLFGSSGLPMQLLGQIWLMADLNKDQKLDPHEFIIAMFLIANRKRGLELPPVVPESLIASAWPDPSSPTQPSLPAGNPPNPALSTPAGSEWIIPPAEKVKYDDLFKKTDSDLDGFISGDQARNLFLRSGVPMSELSRIWLLSDLTQDQRLDKQEFSIAMFLIHCRIKGRELPTPLPDILIASARDDFVPPRSTGASITKNDKSRYDNFSIDDVVASPVVQSLPASGSNSSIPSTTLSLPPEASSVPLTTVPSLEGTRRFNSASNLGSSTQPSLTGPFGASPSVGAHSPAVGLNPAVSSAPAVLAGGSPFPVLSPPFGAVPLVPNPALEVERTRQSIAHHEKTKADMTEQLKEATNIATESARLLEEERARADALVAEIGELESHIGDQRARGNMYKDNITNIRLQVKNMTTQKEQLEELLKEKRLQCEDQEQILTDLRIELDEKTNEAEKYKGEIEQLKARLEHLRTATTEVKAQLATAKKSISDSKAEINRLNEEAKGMKATSSSPPLNTRAASPMNSHPGTPTLPSLHPPATRASSLTSAFPLHHPDSSSTSPAVSHSSSLTSSPSTAPFTFPPPTNDTFSFDNGREDPFAYPSKDGFGLAAVTNDSFGPPAPLQTSPSPPHPTQDQPVFHDANAFFGTSEPFGEPKADSFAKKSSGEVTADPFAASYSFGAAVSGKDAFESFGGSSVTKEGFGSGPASVVIPPTPYNTVIGERKGGLSGADIASAFSAAAFGGSNGAETTNSFFGSTEDTFNAFSNTSDSFGSGGSDSFLAAHDAFAGTSLRESGGFARGSGAFASVDDSFGKQRGSGAFPSVEAEKQRGSGAFPSVEAEKQRGSGAFPVIEGEKQRGSGAFPSIDGDKHRSSGAFPSIEGEKQRGSGAFQAVAEADKPRGSGAFQAVTDADAFGKRDSGAHKAVAPAEEQPAHPFGSDAFSTTDAFGNANAFGSSSNNAFGSPDAFSTTSDAFGSSGHDAFGASSDAFGSGADAFGTSDAFGKSDVFGSAPNNAFGQGSPLKNSGGANGVGEQDHKQPFGDHDVFGKQPDSFGTFDFADKKDGFDF